MLREFAERSQKAWSAKLRSWALLSMEWTAEGSGQTYVTPFRLFQEERTEAELAAKGCHKDTDRTYRRPEREEKPNKANDGKG